MKELYHISDNLFYFYEQTKVLTLAAELDLDAAIIQTKIKADVQYLQSALDAIANALFQMPQNRNRLTHIRSLLKTCSAFKKALELLTGNYSNRDDLKRIDSLLPFFNKMKAQQDELIQVILQLIQDHETQEDSNFISNEEMSILFSDEP